MSPSMEMKQDTDSLIELLERIQRYVSDLSDDELYKQIIYVIKLANKIATNLIPAFDELRIMSMQIETLTSDRMTRERKHQEDIKRIELYSNFSKAGCTPEMIHSASKAEGLSKVDRIMLLSLVLTWNLEVATRFVEQFEA